MEKESGNEEVDEKQEKETEEEAKVKGFSYNRKEEGRNDGKGVKHVLREGEGGERETIEDAKEEEKEVNGGE